MTLVVLAESHQADRITKCTTWEKTENTVKREVIFNCFVLFCTSLHTYMYSAMKASIPYLNVTEMTVICHVISHYVILLSGKVSTVESCSIWLRHLMGIYFMSYTL
jgi:hypothetical protein